jgi:hypothetical protein
LLKKDINGSVHGFMHHKFTFQTICITLIWFLASGFIITVHAGLRGPGKYCGVIVFDRWGTCLLLSGPFVTYISDSVKKDLRPYTGKAMEIDALEVSQPQNPGHALVRKYRIIGPAPNKQQWAMLDGLKLISQPDFGPQGTATFLIELRNSGNQAISVNSSEFGPTLVGLSPKGLLSASDGKSVARITRTDVLNSTGWEGDYYGLKYLVPYTIDPKSRPPYQLQLASGECMRVRVTFSVPPGQYQFVVGYGGGVHEEKSLASNAISFDVNDSGIATLARPEISSAP